MRGSHASLPQMTGDGVRLTTIQVFLPAPCLVAAWPVLPHGAPVHRLPARRA